MTRAPWIGAALLGLCLAGVAWADVSVQGGKIGTTTSPIKSVTVVANTNSAGNFGAGNFIIGFKLSTTAASAHCSLYDAATVTGTQFDELSEASADETIAQIWPNPYQLTTDLSIDVINGICTVYYY